MQRPPKPERVTSTVEQFTTPIGGRLTFDTTNYISRGQFGVVYRGDFERAGQKTRVIVKRGILNHAHELFTVTSSERLIERLQHPLDGEPQLAFEGIRATVVEMAALDETVRTVANNLKIAESTNIEELREKLSALTQTPQVQQLYREYSARQQLFEQEAKALSLMQDDPKITRLYDHGLDTEGRPYLVLEEAQGQSLDSTHLTPANFAHVMGETLQVLGRAHAKGITNRDVDASGIFVKRDPTSGIYELTKVIDWGLAAGGKIGLFSAEELFDTPYRIFGRKETMLESDAIALDSPFRDLHAVGVMIANFIGEKQNDHFTFPERAVIRALMVTARAYVNPGIIDATRRETDQADFYLQKIPRRDFYYSSAEQMLHDVSDLRDTLNTPTLS